MDAKARAVEAFLAAQAIAAAGATGALAADQRSAAEQLAARLRDLAQENRRLLEHAIAVQGRVIGLVARALPPSHPRTRRATARMEGWLEGYVSRRSRFPQEPEAARPSRRGRQR